MNKHSAQLLEQHFDTAFAAPDGIAKLRELTLTLAMQGKLVEQDPNDPPASELLKEIEAEKRRLVEAGKMRQPPDIPPIKPEEEPYELPQGWEWVRLGTLVSKLGSGSTPRGGKSAYTSEGISFLRSQNVWNDGLKLDDVAYITEKTHQKMEATKVIAKDILLNITGASLGRTALVPDQFTEANVSQHVTIIRCIESGQRRFVHLFLLSPYCQKLIWTRQVGMAREGLSKKVLEQFEVPMPPLPEQHRIVTRIDHLMARCDELEKLRKARETQRLAVHTTAIKQLLEVPEGSAWDFIQQHFGELYTVKQNVAELRKAILQLAVMGRLVEQDPNDPPASELLKEIEAEKQRLVKAGKIKQPKPLPPLKLEELPCELPQEWNWVRFDEIVDIGSGITKGRKLNGRKLISIPYLRVANVKRGYLELSEIKEIEIPIEETTKYQLLKGDLLITEGGDWDKVGRTCLWMEEIPNCGHQNHVFRARKVLAHQSEIWLEKYLNSPIAREYFARASKQTTNLASINKTQLRSCPIPLPPLPEQHRIVTRIDQLMTFCDTLEQQIDAASKKQSELLNALLHAKPELHNNITDLATYRSTIGCYIVKNLSGSPYFGRTTAAKALYLAQAHVGLNLDLNPVREAAGPLDKWIYDFEREGKNNSWFEVNEKHLKSGNTKTEYRCLPALSKPAAKIETLISSEKKTELSRLIHTLADKKTEEVEIIATLFAVWNDFLIDGVTPSDEQIIKETRENWHERKARFSVAELARWLNWLRNENMVPRGLPPRTIQQSTLKLV